MKIGILGLGSIGTRHFENALALGHEVLGFDTEPTRMNALNGGRRHPARDDLIGWADAVIVATPTSEHYMDTFCCTARHKPVLVEKPIAATRDQYDQMLSRGFASVPLWVGYNLRFHPCAELVREWLTAGSIGNVRFATFVCAQRNTKYTDDLLLNWSHEIDLAFHLLGPAKISAGTVDGLMIAHRSGARSAIHLNYETSPQARFFDIVGSAGFIRVNLADCSAHLHDKQGEHPHFFLTRVWDETYVKELQAFTDAVGGRATQLCTASQGLDVLRHCLGDA